MTRLPKLVGVVGAGQMGCGIAELFAQKGFPTVLTDISDAVLSQGQKRVETSVNRRSDLTNDQKQRTLERISVSTQLEHFSEAELIVEAVSENEEVCQFIGLHFMKPAPRMDLIEIVRGMQTSQESYERALGIAAALGKITCTSNDRPGFIVNRILMPMINEAFFALMEGVATAEEIDIGMKHGTNQPMGPLALADFIGLDICLAIITVMHESIGEDKYRPCPLLRQYVDAGWHGKKVGRGVFKYTDR